MSPLDRLAGDVDRLACTQARVLVAVDGPDAAGKTTLADALAGRLASPVVRASVDSFHQPAAVRRQRGGLSPEGYYRDSFDHAALEGELLEPFRSGADRVRTGRFDHRADASAVTDSDVPPRCVLVLDGVFLLRPELRHWWTLSVYLHVPPEVTLVRARLRDLADLGSVAEVERRYRARYLPGQALYREEADPEGCADVVLDNTAPEAPVVLRWA